MRTGIEATIQDKGGDAMSTTLVGLFGTALAIIAFVPQIFHLIKEHCSAGISFQAYAIWSIASLLLLTHAVTIKDPIFIALQSYHMEASALIALFAKKYEQSICEGHRL